MKKVSFCWDKIPYEDPKREPCKEFWVHFLGNLPHCLYLSDTTCKGWISTIQSEIFGSIMFLFSMIWTSYRGCTQRSIIGDADWVWFFHLAVKQILLQTLASNVCRCSLPLHPTSADALGLFVAGRAQRSAGRLSQLSLDAENYDFLLRNEHLLDSLFFIPGSVTFQENDN